MRDSACPDLQWRSSAPRESVLLPSENVGRPRAQYRKKATAHQAFVSPWIPPVVRSLQFRGRTARSLRQVVGSSHVQHLHAENTRHLLFVFEVGIAEFFEPGKVV